MVTAETTPPGVNSRRALTTLSGILFLTFLDTTIMSVALADMQATLHAGVSSLQWVVNGYALVFAAFMLAAGTLGDRLGRKKVMLFGVAVFIAGSLLGALAPNIRIDAFGPGRSAYGPLSRGWRWRWGRSWAESSSVWVAGGLSSGSTWLPESWP